MTKILICLDNQPNRYQKLRKILHDIGIVLVTTCRVDDLLEYLNGPAKILGICLTFEMPFGTGVMFASYLKEYSYSVVIIDSDKYGIGKLKEKLTELNLKFATAAHNIDGWEELVLKLFNISFDNYQIPTPLIEPLQRPLICPHKPNG